MAAAFSASILFDVRLVLLVDVAAASSTSGATSAKAAWKYYFDDHPIHGDLLIGIVGEECEFPTSFSKFEKRH